MRFDNAARNRTISPIAIIDGAPKPCAAASIPARARLVTKTRCRGVVALLTIATGRSGDTPAASRASAISARRLIPI